MNSKENPFFFYKERTLWEVNKEKAVLLAGGRALLMQLAHPLIAQAVEDTDFMQKKPYERLHRTAEAGLGLIFGTDEQVFQIANRINLVHEHLNGSLKTTVGNYPKGERYDATNPELLQWVAATIIDSSIVGFEKFIRPLSEQDKSNYLKDTIVLFKLLKVDTNYFPNSYWELTSYIEEMINTEKIKVSKTAKELAPYALLRYSPVREMITFPFFKITVGLLPEKLREQYGFSWQIWEEKILSGFSSGMQKIVPFLPRQLRYVPDYQRTQRILK